MNDVFHDKKIEKIQQNLALIDVKLPLRFSMSL